LYSCDKATTINKMILIILNSKTSKDVFH
jgi:hypothetical protein